MFDSYTTGNSGERLVAAALEMDGYSVYMDTKAPGATDVVALRGLVTLRIQVKTSVWPSKPSALSFEEKSKLVSYAAARNQLAYLAQVVVDATGHLTEQIKWVRLT